MTTISVRELNKSFGDVPVLQECNLDVAEHEFLVLVGPSGSGKTTLLRLIAGLEQPTSGHVLFGDEDVSRVDVGDRDVAMVFQNYGLYPHMSVRDNMSLGLIKRGVSKGDARQRVTDASAMLQIDHLLDRKPRQLSGGQRQRVALGRSIVRDPRVFLLDEPLSNLDAHLRVQMRAEILKVHRAVTAPAVYVTHDQVEALTMGDRVAVMNEGRIQQIGPPQELYDHPVNMFVGSFIGTPAMGMVPAKVADDDGARTVGGPSIRLHLSPTRAEAVAQASGPEVVVGIRPEALTLRRGGDQIASYLDGVVQVVEPLGWEQHVLLDVDGKPVTARLPRSEQVAMDDRLTFAVDPDAVTYFDAETQQALR